MSKSLTTGQIAKYCGVNFRTVIRWIERGLIKAYKLPGRGDNRVEVEDFVRFLRDNDMPVPPEFVQTTRVLVVDDDLKMARSIRRALIGAGFEVDIAHSGFEAGAKLTANLPSLMTLDLNMPGIGGIDVLRSVRESHGNSVKVVVVSGASSKELQEALAAGADAVLEKPFVNAELIGVVRELVGQAA